MGNEQAKADGNKSTSPSDGPTPPTPATGRQTSTAAPRSTTVTFIEPIVPSSGKKKKEQASGSSSTVRKELHPLEKETIENLKKVSRPVTSQTSSYLLLTQIPASF